MGILFTKIDFFDSSQNFFICNGSVNDCLTDLFKQNKFNISPELEYTAAKWGDMNAKGKAENNLKDVGNFRGMVRVMYSF